MCIYTSKCDSDATPAKPTGAHSSLTDAPLAAAVELGALQVIVVAGVAGVVLVVGVVVLLVVLVMLRLLDDIVSRTSSKQESATLMTSHTGNKHKHKHRRAFSTNKPAASLLTIAAALTVMTSPQDSTRYS